MSSAEALGNYYFISHKIEFLNTDDRFTFLSQ
jgi:hypothetical protein